MAQLLRSALLRRLPPVALLRRPPAPPRGRPLSSIAAPFLDGSNITVCREWGGRSKRVGALGMKCGMTMAWTPEGDRWPLTVIEIQDLQVCQVKHQSSCSRFPHGLQLGGGWQKRKRLKNWQAGEFEARGLPYKLYLGEFRVTADALLPVGTSITARHFVPGQKVDVQGVTKGKGFQGVMKRWGFKGQPASHGVSKTHRKPGGSGGASGGKYRTRVNKGKKMPGRMGGKRRTMQSLVVHKVDAEHNLVYLKGSVPGVRGSIVRLKDAFLHRDRFTKDAPPPFPTFLPGDDEAAPAAEASNA